MQGKKVYLACRTFWFKPTITIPGGKMKIILDTAVEKLEFSKDCLMEEIMRGRYCYSATYRYLLNVGRRQT
jgi:hypothetical protein